MVDDILKKYPDDVKVVIKNFPLSFHKQAKLAAQYCLAAREQGGLKAYKELYKKIFDNFRSLKSNPDLPVQLAKEMGLDIDYIHSSPEKLTIEKKFNVILNMEVVEHVSNVDLFIQNCSSLLEKKGIMFVATINRNLKSYVQAILGAEYVLRWLPIGTHDWNKFITPSELKTIVTTRNFTIDEVIGMKFNLINRTWNKSSDTSVNYISTFLKN